MAVEIRKQFLLNDTITYLNFGAFGGCPLPVFQAYQRFQLELEQDPSHFLLVTGPQYLVKAREALATYINCSADDVVYVTNPSYAVNIVAKNLQLQPGDEVLSTNIEYGACDRAWSYYCKQKGASYVQQRIHFPIASKEDFIAQFFAGLTANTKLIFISHITSSTGLRLPVEEICAIAKQKGIPTFVDGAHAPGQVPVDLETLQADYYTGACHKWMLAPKGCSFLFVKRELQGALDPLLISWGYESAAPSSSQFLDYQQQQGTRDYAAFLSVPAAIAFMQAHNWHQVSETCRTLAQTNAHRFFELLDSKPMSPITNDFIAQMVSVPINTNAPQQIHDLLYQQYQIQVPVMIHEKNYFLRYSVQGYNTQQDLDLLYNALQEIKLSHPSLFNNTVS